MFPYFSVLKQLRFFFLYLHLTTSCITYTFSQGNVTLPTRSFNLSQAIKSGLENNQRIKNAGLDIEIAKEKIKETFSIGFPQIFTEGNFQHFIDIPTQVAPANMFDSKAPGDLLIPIKFGTTYNGTASISASQLVFDGSYFVGLQAAKVYKQLFEKQKVFSEIEVRDMIMQTYCAVLAAQKGNAFLKKTYSNLDSIHRQITLMYQQGFMDKLEVEQSELTLLNLSVQIQKSVTDIEKTNLLLKFQMGIPLESDIELTDSLQGIVEELKNENLREEVSNFKSHISMQIFATQMELLKLNLKKERAQRLPHLGVFLNHGQYGYSNTFEFKSWYPTTLWGINLRIPVFDGLGQSRRIKQSKFEIEKAQNSFEQLQQGLQLEYLSAKAECRDANEHERNAKSNVSLAEKVLDKTLIRHKQGLASSLEVSQVQNQYLTAESMYLMAIMENIQSNMKLRRAKGE
ncbi:MAG: hypothetical protein A3H98_06720 [Bacteroidetes bacterium RIFCSPLOWO2_02_FULL_36_8]|nr:MAG: hypothetical protein A3H98_06720 [Bacteroidetes bacterium RIFCSPLOWO2_02_FULL_36_8]OFY71157.1 MAG: hypothetical protein A3G23_15230 [Bacteroidetes bacterium RIFCSPLOWO2_12_FULL_37_12]